jgi:hypothetical protein
MGNTLKLPSPTKLAQLGHFPPASQAARLAGPVFYVYVFSQLHPKTKEVIKEQPPARNLSAAVRRLLQGRVF